MLHQLWEKRDVNLQRLTLASYEDLGGLKGVLNCHAESIYQTFAVNNHDYLVWQLFLKLVRVSVETKVTRQSCYKDDLLKMFKGPNHQLAIKIIDKFVDQRIPDCIRVDNCDAVELVHESLILCWDRLAKKISEQRKSLELIQYIETKRWRKERLSISMLNEATKLKKSKDLLISDELKKYIRNNLLRSLIPLFSMILIGIILLSFTFWHGFSGKKTVDKAYSMISSNNSISKREAIKILTKGCKKLSWKWSFYSRLFFEYCLPLNKEGKSKLNLCGVNLSGLNLRNSNLSNTNLGFANLSYADLSYTNLSDTNLTYAILVRTNLNHANLTNSILSKSIINDSSMKDLNLQTIKFNKDISCGNCTCEKDKSPKRSEYEGAILTNVDLSNSNLEGVDLRYVTLLNPKLMNTNLAKVNLSGANLTGDNLKLRTNVSKGLNLRNLNLSGSNLEGANLSGLKIIQANFNGAKLSGIIVKESNLNEANFTDAKFDNDKFNLADFTKANLSNAIFSKNKIPESDCNLSSRLRVSVRVDFSGANLHGANLNCLNLDTVNFSNANLNSANLSYASLNKAILTDASLNGTMLEKTSLMNSDISRANLANSQLKEANISNATLDSANLYQAKLWFANLSNANLMSANLMSADLREANLYYSNLQNIIWDKNTNWNGVKNRHKIKNIANELKDKLGLSGIP